MAWSLHFPEPDREPLVWALFGAGGMVAALVFPALAGILWIAVPLGLPGPLEHEGLRLLALHPVMRMAMGIVLPLLFFHWAHRFRHILHDGLQLYHLGGGAVAPGSRERGRSHGVEEMSREAPAARGRSPCTTPESLMSDMHDDWTPMSRQTPVGRRGFLARAGASLMSTRMALPLFGSGAALILSACGGRSRGSGEHPVPELLPREEWREILPADRFRILFEDQTEPAGSSPLDKIYDPGTYVCAACFQPLFSSEAKYDSTTGWPSFWTHLPGAVGTRPDDTFFMRRTECHCSRCGGHQGHVFDDGPPPTGERWCINGLALEFVPQGQALPELRG